MAASKKERVYLVMTSSDGSGIVTYARRTFGFSSWKRYPRLTSSAFQKRFAAVKSLVVDSQDRLIVCDYGNSRVVILTEGLEDDVDYHWGQLFKAALLSTLLSVGSEAGNSGNESDIARALRQGASNSTSQIGQQIVGRQLNIQPTLTIRPGFPVRIIVNHDLVLKPYGAKKEPS